MGSPVAPPPPPPPCCPACAGSQHHPLVRRDLHRGGARRARHPDRHVAERARHPGGDGRAGPGPGPDPATASLTHRGRARDGAGGAGRRRGRQRGASGGSGDGAVRGDGDGPGTRLLVQSAPAGRVVTALERVAGGHFAERLPEDQPDEFGAIARGVNRMAATLAWREGLHEYLAQLLAALNAPPDEAASGLTQALGVIAGATHASGIALYQPSYDPNDWGATAARGLEPSPVSRATMRSIVGDSEQAIHFTGEAANPVRYQLHLTVPVPHGLVLAPLRSGRKLVGVLCVVPGAPFEADARAALEQAAPNLAIAGERESAHYNTRRLATEVRLTARRLEELNTELDVAMRSKDQFLSNISHELRTPLNSIIGFTDLLLTPDLGGGPLSEQQRDFLDTVARNARHLLELINELLDLQRIAAGRMELRPEPVEVAALLAEAADSVQAQAQKHRHALVVESPPQGLRVFVDRGRVRQVLLNLLSNAIKFTPDGGRIRVDATPANGGAAARVAVTDSGIGIAPEDQAKLFHEFVQLDASASRKYEGTGLGLALSRRLIELHGGAIGVESE